MHCTQCGSENPDDVKTCWNCYHAVSQPSQPLVPQLPNAPSQSGVKLGPTLIGVKGWLLFLCVWLVILYPLVGVFLIGYSWAKAQSYFAAYPGLRSAEVFSALMNIGMMGYSIFAGYGLWSVKINAVRNAKIYFLVWLVGSLALLYPVIALSHLPSVVSDAYGYEAGKEFFYKIIVVVYWITYLSRSRRVQVTYSAATVLPPQSPLSPMDKIINACGLLFLAVIIVGTGIQVFEPKERSQQFEQNSVEPVLRSGQFDPSTIQTRK